ncbi:MAG: FHIPEP family type III secretion protein, partial [Firmicutes bacterium]|nr:FHIPEP family type III secretion protein [Bacillota bacterium]
AMNGSLDGIADVIRVKDPVYGQDAAWIPLSAKARAELTGATVIDASTVLLTHLGAVIRRHAHELLTREGTRQLIDHVRQTHPTVVQELLPDVLSIGEIQQVLQHLLREGVTIRDLPTILEALADRARASRAVVDLTEAARQALGRTIVQPYLSHDGRLHVIVLAPATEQWLAAHRVMTDTGPVLSIPPEVAQTWLGQLRAAVSQ